MTGVQTCALPICNETVTVVTRVLLVLANQSKAHVYVPPLLCLDLCELLLSSSNGFIPLLLARLRGVRAGAFSERCAEALDGIQHNAGRLALGVVSELDCVVDLLYVVAVLKLDYVPAKSVELCADALAMAHDLVNGTIELVLVVVYEAYEIVELVVSCELSSLPNLTLVALAVADEYEYVAVAP